MPNRFNLRENPENAYAEGSNRSYGGYQGSLRVDVPATATTYPITYPGLNPAIQSLLTPGLVPDIARMSAEVSAGRGVAGSPAADSTAVRMSEQNYLQRLGLANSLLSGEASRTLPYQITPYQSVETALRQQALQNQRDIAQLQYGVRSGVAPSGGGGAPRANTPWAGFVNQPFVGQQPLPTGDFHGTRPSDVAPTPFTPNPGGYNQPMSLDDMIDSMLGLGAWQGSGGGGGGGGVDDGGLGFDYLE